jgi:glycosidase
MPGAGDPDNRRMMRFDSLNSHEQYLKSVTAKLTALRSSSLALTYGDFSILKVNEKTFVYLRSYFNQFVVVVFNKDKQEHEVAFELPDRFAGSELSAQWATPFTAANGKVTLTVPGNSFEIFTPKEK